jgi:hypothetical protein
MQSIQTPRNDKGVVVNVRINTRLASLQAEVNRLHTMERTATERIGQIDYERTINENSLLDVEQQAKWELRRIQLKAEYDAAYRSEQEAQAKRKAAELEYSEWLQNFGRWEYELKQLQRELPNALGGDSPTMMSSNLGDAPQRSKTDVENELVEVLRKLAVFSGDAALMREYESTSKRIADSRPYVFLKNSYVTLASGELVSEEEFQRRAVEFGDVISRGAHSSPYMPGRPIPREEAAQLGLT